MVIGVQRTLRRTGAMARKETLHIVRDPRNLYMAVGLPVVLLILFGYGISFDLDHVPIGLVDQDRTPASREVVRSITAAGELVVASTPDDPDEADHLFRTREARAVVVLPRGLHRSSARGGAVQVLLDGSDGVSANSVLGTILGTVNARNAATLATVGATPPLDFRVRLLYNPALRSAVFFVPGLIALVLLLASVLLTALTVAREWERGNMEQLLATPVGRVEVILGKLLPYLAIGMLQALLIVTVGTVWFDVPVQGSVAVLALGTLLFLVAALGQGLLISVVTRNQQVATQVGAVSSILPGVLLSGFVVPIENMPHVLQVLASLFPARYYVAFLRSVMLKDAPWSVLMPQLGAMALYGFAMLSLCVLRFRRGVNP